MWISTPKKKCEDGNDNDAAAQAKERARHARENGDAERDQDEVEGREVLEPSHSG